MNESVGVYFTISSQEFTREKITKNKYLKDNNKYNAGSWTIGNVKYGRWLQNMKTYKSKNKKLSTILKKEEEDKKEVKKFEIIK